MKARPRKSRSGSRRRSLLVTDASGIARSIAAMAAGYAHFDPALNVAGCHLQSRRRPRASRHAADGVGRRCRSSAASPTSPSWRFLSVTWDFERDEIAVPQTSFSTRGERLPPSGSTSMRSSQSRSSARAPEIQCTRPNAARIAAAMPNRIACDEAFHFYYEDNLRRLEECGAEMIGFSPSHDLRFPRSTACISAAAIPKPRARAVGESRRCSIAIRQFAKSARPMYAECGGLMYLCEAIRTLDGETWPMAGLIPGVAVMAPRLQALGYVEVETRADSILGAAGTRFRGHQFRYSTLEENGGAKDAASSIGDPSGAQCIRRGLHLSQRGRLLRPCALGVESVNRARPGRACENFRMRQ